MRQPRRGWTLIEVAAAGALTAILASASLETLRLLAEHRQAGDRRRIAREEAATLMERIAALPPADRSQAAIERLRKETASPSLAGAERSVRWEAIGDPPLGRATIEISWTEGAARARPVRLVAFFEPAKEAGP